MVTTHNMMIYLLNRLAIHGSCVRPLWSSRLASRRASAFACCHDKGDPLVPTTTHRVAWFAT